ncbi:MAG TPA: hypothetical protein PKM50_09635 [Methanoregula sp.]|nr:hypothetical protein [Methanoregula sp.]
MTKSKIVGARKAGEQLALARKHYTKMYSIIQEYKILTPEIDRVDCVCDLAEIETILMEIENSEPEQGGSSGS